MRRSSAPPLRRRSMVWRAALLAAAWMWAAAVVAFYYGYHFAQPSSPWAEGGGHIYYTHPPAQTLAQGDHASARIVTIALALAVGVGTLDLVVRLLGRVTAPGGAALVAGGMLVVFSLFGLLRGLAGIGTPGLLVILSGLPMHSTPTGDPVRPVPPEIPADWYADPTGRYDVRYWDGASWGALAATGGVAGDDPLWPTSSGSTTQ